MSTIYDADLPYDTDLTYDGESTILAKSHSTLKGDPENESTATRVPPITPLHG